MRTLTVTAILVKKKDQYHRESNNQHLGLPKAAKSRTPPEAAALGFCFFYGVEGFAGKK